MENKMVDLSRLQSNCAPETIAKPPQRQCIHRKVSKWNTCHKPPFAKGRFGGIVNMTGIAKLCLASPFIRKNTTPNTTKHIE